MGNIKIEEFAPAAQTRGRFDSELSLALRPQAAATHAGAPFPFTKHYGATLIAYLLTSWVASIAILMGEAFAPIDRRLSVLLAIAFVSVLTGRHTTAVPPVLSQEPHDDGGAALDILLDRVHGKLDLGESQVKTGLGLFQAAERYRRNSTTG